MRESDASLRQDGLQERTKPVSIGSMPTFVALIAASVAGYLASKLLGEVSVIGSTVVSFCLGIVVYYVTKRFLIRIKP